MDTPVVSRISIAPVKSLGLVHPDEVTLTHAGVPGDRRYAVVDSAGHIANGKRLGPLVRIRSEIGEDPETLALRFPGGAVVDGRVELGEEIDALFYGEERRARLVLGGYSEALTRAAGHDLRLVRMVVPGDGIDRGGEGAVSLLSSAALETLAAAADLDGPIDDRRFRMTFLVDGLPAHAEDGWLGRHVRVGEAVIRPLGNIGRCAVTTQDPDTGVRSLDTLRLIAQTRGSMPATEPLPFGVHAEVLTPGRVRVGDAVEVERQPAATTR